MHEEYIKLEHTRRNWSIVVAVGLAAELAGAVLLLTGKHRLGLLVALAGVILWMAARSVGNKRYTASCADLRVRYGLHMQDAVKQDGKALQDEIPTFPLLPEAFRPNKPLLLHPYKGRWQGMDALVAEMTVGYLPAEKQHQFLSGSLLRTEAPCAVPGLLAIYDHPYGGVSLSKWEGMTPVDTGDRGYLLLAPEGTEVSEYILDAFAGFVKNKETPAIIWTEASRVYTFLPVQFYSGTWTLFKFMPEAAVGADPLPALEELPKLLKKLA